MRRTTFFLAVFSFLTLCSVSADREISFAERKTFIGEYIQIAVTEMHRTGVPASITLAQFILESDWGRAELFVNANAGFGVKCKENWKGETYFIASNEYNKKYEKVESCFRKYASVEATFRDHSDFLRNRSYYQPLFLLERNDYRGWAYGLKECKYATDPKYPAKLIRIIETYGLHIYDYEVENTPAVTKPTIEINETIPAQIVTRPTAIMPVVRPQTPQSAPTQQQRTEPVMPSYNGVQYPVVSPTVVPAKIYKKRRVIYQVKPRHRRPVSVNRP